MPQTYYCAGFFHIIDITKGMPHLITYHLYNSFNHIHSFAFKVISNKLECESHQSCHYFPVASYMVGFCFINYKGVNINTPACEDMTWTTTLRLSFCPICWRDEETVGNHSVAEHLV